MRIGLAQMDIFWENVQKNMEKAEDFIKKAKENQVELLIFPEMTLTGFSMHVEKTTKDWQQQVHFFEEMSRQYEISIIFGYPAPAGEPVEPEKGRHGQQLEAVSSVAPVGPERGRHGQQLGAVPSAGISGQKMYHNHLALAEHGRVRMDYTKLHPFTFGQEGECFSGGEEIVCTPWEDTMLGVFICYDLRFPEIFQISSAKSELIVLIANWPVSRIDDWDCLLKARAVENQAYIAAVNRTGEGGGLLYNGHSALFGPRGERLTTLCQEESLLIGEVDPEYVRRCRDVFPLKKDRREELYRKSRVRVVPADAR